MAEENDTYLAKWLNDDLTSQNLEQYTTPEELEDYKKIVKGLEYFHAPAFDEDQSLAVTLEKLQPSKKEKVIRMKPIIYAISAAASILLVFGIFFAKITYTSDPGQQLAVVLPDGSSVSLNAGSTLSHKRFFWSKNRNVSLEGEAFFTVNRGTNFTVTSGTGAVEVLGTQFNVKTRKYQFLVECYEGKVQVSTNTQQKELQKGDAVFLKDEKLILTKITNTSPQWIQGESLFSGVPLKEVLDEIERQYAVTFIRNKVDQNKLFTGGFIHTNLDIALESVLVPMGIRYTVNNSNITLSTP